MPAKPPAGDSTSFSLREWALSAGALLLIFSVVGTWGQFDFSNLMGYYDLLADAFLKGQLHIDIRPDQTYLHDMIPYGGRYYLQWGPFPALVHLLAELIGLPLSDRVACILAGWLTSLVFLQIMLVLRRRFFPGLPKPACLCFFFAFALGTPTALVSLRGTVYHESIVFGVLGVMGAFLALLHYQEQGSWKWALAAGLGIGVATASRVSLAVSGIVLGLVLLIIQYLRKHPLSTAASHVGAYSLPILVSGTLLMAYNQARFGSPWEYGNRYLPSITAGLAPFDPGRVPENLRHYLLAPIQLTGDFPWLVHEGWLPLVDTTRAEDMSSLLIGSPFLLLAVLCWPLWREDRPRDLRLFVGAAAISSSLAFGVMLCFASAGRRYAHDFVPLWMILAVVGLALQLEKRFPWRRWRLAAWGMVILSALLHMHLSFTQSFTWDPPDLNVMKTFVAVSPTARSVMPAGPKWNEEEAIIRNDMGSHLFNQGQVIEALGHFERAAELKPNDRRIQKNLALARERARARQLPGRR